MLCPSFRFGIGNGSRFVYNKRVESFDWFELFVCGCLVISFLVRLQLRYFYYAMVLKFMLLLLLLLLFWVPSSGGDLNGEVGGREEGEDLGGHVVPAVVHALAE